jgi:hypothetical protein
MSLNSTPGDAAAESYFSIAEADAYFTARGNAAWVAALTATKEQFARIGTQYLDNNYRDRWVGIRTGQTQALAWPRVDGSRGNRNDTFGYAYTFVLYDTDGFVIASDSVPTQVKQAAMEAALLALGGTALEPTLERGGRIKSLSEQVGPISTSTTWEDGAAARDTFTVIDGYLRGLVRSSNSAKMVRS